MCEGSQVKEKTVNSGEREEEQGSDIRCNEAEHLLRQEKRQ